MKSYLNILFISLSLLFLYGCSSDEPGANGTSKGIMLSAEESAVCETMEPFNMKIFGAACKVTNSSHNVLLSPLSLSMFLSMRANYSEEETKAAILKVLGYDNLDDINTLNAKLLNQLRGLDNKTTLNMANSVWYDDKYSVLETAEDNLTKYYNAEFFPCDPSLASSRKKVGDWVMKKTKNCINFEPKHYFPYLVINALYFNGEWQQQFNPKDTRKERFAGRDVSSTVNMMHSSNKAEQLAYGEDFKACRKVFGNGAFSCTFVLPDEDYNIDEFALSLTSRGITDLEFHGYPCNLSVPSFELAQKFDDLEEIFQEMGIEYFTGSILKDYNSAPYFSHETYFKIDEEGATVAAITLEGYLLSPGNGPRSFTLDRPFLFFINEQSTGACILAGKIVNL